MSEIKTISEFKKNTPVQQTGMPEKNTAVQSPVPIFSFVTGDCWKEF